MTDSHDPQISPDDAVLHVASDTLKLLADRTRLHVMVLLSRSPADVGTLVAEVGASRTAVSQHLAKLRLAGLVTTRKESRTVVYSIPDDHLATLVTEILSHADHRVRGEAFHRVRAPESTSVATSLDVG